MTSIDLPRHGSSSSQPSHTPSPRRSANTCRRALIAFSPSMNSAWRALTPSQHLGRVDDVEHRAGDRAGERIAAVGRAMHADGEHAARSPSVVSIAPTGNPPPRPFALVRMSGTTPFCMYENSVPVRPIPLWISSRTSSAPCAVQSRRAACRYSGVPASSRLRPASARG